MKPVIIILAVVLLACGLAASADDAKFSAHLHAKFQVKGCTTCHDFLEKSRGGISFTSHQGRTPDMCVFCHTQEVTGFEHADEWFARPGLYTSGMDAKQTCETIKTALNAKFKNEAMSARDLEKHLFEDPRILWAIEGATPKSGNLPGGNKEKDLVKGGLTEWKNQVGAWIKGGMKCSEPVAVAPTPAASPPAVKGPPNKPANHSGRTACLVCHEKGISGAPKPPANHAGRTDGSCSVCHQ